MTQVQRATEQYAQVFQLVAGEAFLNSWRTIADWAGEAFGRFGLEINETVWSGPLGDELSEFHREFRRLDDIALKVAEIGASDQETLTDPKTVIFVDHMLSEFKRCFAAIIAAVNRFESTTLGDAVLSELQERNVQPSDVHTVLQQFKSSTFLEFQAWAENLHQHVKAAKAEPLDAAATKTVTWADDTKPTDDGMPESSAKASARQKAKAREPRRDASAKELSDKGNQRLQKDLMSKIDKERTRLERQGKREPMLEDMKARDKDQRKARAKQHDSLEKSYRTLTFEELWANPAARQDFGRYLRLEHSFNEFAFLDAVDRYKNGEVTAQQVYDTFIVPDSDVAVNISGVIRDGIKKGMNSPEKELFQRAYSHVQSTLIGDSFLRYRKSDPDVVAEQTTAEQPDLLRQPVAGAEELRPVYTPMPAEASSSASTAVATEAPGQPPALREHIRIAFVFGAPSHVPDSGLQRRGSVENELELLTTYLGVTRDHLEKAKAETLARWSSGEKDVKFFTVRDTLAITYDKIEDPDGNVVGDNWAVAQAAGALVSDSVQALPMGQSVQYTQYEGTVIVNARPGVLDHDIMRYAAAASGNGDGLATVTFTGRAGLDRHPKITVQPLSENQNREAFEAKLRKVHPRAKFTWTG